MAGEQDPKRQGSKPGEDTSGLIDLLELAATEKKTQTGKHPAVGRTPQGGTRAVSDTGRRSVIRVPTPATGESRVPTPTGTSGRNGAVVRTMTPPTGTPVVAAPPVAAPPPAAAKSKLPLIIGGVVAAAAVVGGYLVLMRPSAQVVAAAPPAESPVARPEAPKPVEAPKPLEAAKPAEPGAKPAEAEAVAAVKVEAKEKPAHEGASKKEPKVAKVETAKATDKPEPKEKAEPKATKAAGDDPFPVKGKDKPAAEEPPKTEAARLAGEAVTKEKKDKKSKGGDELSNVLSASGEKEKPAAAKAEDAVPEKLSQGDLKKGMGPVAKRAADCYEKYQVPGLAKVQLTIEASGKVAGAKVLGSYDGTPTGQCLLDAINKASFPKTKSPLSLTYPFMLR